VSNTRHAELVHWMSIKDKKTFIPACADIDFTNICNQDCYYCSTTDFRKSVPVQNKKEDFLTLISQMATWREHSPKSIGTFSTVIFTGGGEPTLMRGYEEVIEYTIDQGILPSIITNGSNLDKLTRNVPLEKIKKMLYIGVDVDAGSKDLYEQIRRSKPAAGLYDKVMDNISELASKSGNVDLKVVLNEFNCSDAALNDLFALAAKTKVRQLYFRALYDFKTHYVFPIQDYIQKLEALAAKYNVVLKYNTNRLLPKNYNRCHQMFLMPVFCADGNIYTCCENKGNPAFSIGRWKDVDFRDAWLSSRHFDVYDGINTNFCHPCRPNSSNIAIQNVINDPTQLERLLM
jgi:sulfatase maturation enzyme AslB (radical SAM superfamily)